MTRFDPMARARDFTFGPHPRRGTRPVEVRVSEIEQQVIALPPPSLILPNPPPAILNVLPDPQSYQFGNVVTVQGAAGQPSESYVLGQDAFDAALWQAINADKPIRFDFWKQFGSTGSGAGQFSAPTSATASDTYLWISDFVQGRVQRFLHDGTWVSTHGPSATLADNPNRIAYDFTNDRIGVAGLDSASADGFQVWPADFSARIFQVGSTGTGNGEFQTAFGLGADSAGNWYVVDISNSRVQKFDDTGAYVDQWGSNGTGDGEFNAPTSLYVDEDDNIHVIDAFNYRVQKFDSSGAFLLSYGSQGNGPGQFAGQPTHIAGNRIGLMFVTHGGAGAVQVFSTDGEFITRFGRKDFGFAGQASPSTVAAYEALTWVADATLDNVHIWRGVGDSNGPAGPTGPTGPTGSVDAHDHDTDYVELAGDTMTGALEIRTDTLPGLVVSRYVNDANSTRAQFRKSRHDTDGSHTIVQDGDFILNIAGYASDGAGFVEAARIAIAVDGTPGTNDMPGRIILYTTPDGANVALERVRIDNAGNVTINEDGLDSNTRIEGENDPNLVYVDASTDRVGIGTNTPAELFDVDGTLRATAINLGGTLLTPTAAEINFVDGVTSAIQTQLDGKSGTGHTHSNPGITVSEDGSGAVTDATHLKLDATVFNVATTGASDAVVDINNDAISYAQIQNVSASDRLLGRVSASAGDIEEIPFSDFAQSLLDDADAGVARTTLGLAIGTNVQAWDAHLDDLAAISPSQGDIIYFNGTDWVALGAGTAGHFLKTNGAAANPAWAAAGGGGALVYVTGNSFTTSSDVNVDSCFSATYRNYLLIVTITATSTTLALTMQMRASGADDANANYNYSNQVWWNAGAYTIGGGTSATSFGQLLNGAAEWEYGHLFIDIGAPQVAERTHVTWIGGQLRTTPLQLTNMGHGAFNNITQFDGFSLEPSAGTISGFYRVYGRTDS